MADHNEVVFESEICAYLETHGVHLFKGRDLALISA